MRFLIGEPTSFSSIEKLPKKWQMVHTDNDRHPPKEIGRARPIFFCISDCLLTRSIGVCQGPPFELCYELGLKIVRANLVRKIPPLFSLIIVFTYQSSKGFRGLTTYLHPANGKYVKLSTHRTSGLGNLSSCEPERSEPAQSGSEADCCQTVFRPARRRAARSASCSGGGGYPAD